MFEKVRCQSCGMPLNEEVYGTNHDGSVSKEYCMRCFQQGTFTEPNLTKEGMVKRSTEHMISELHFSEEVARELALRFIPQLKRWQTS